ncbi:hypothetical protein PGTUg99_031875 [Puccinia graminis f. sp. tritici]|uniref:Uncharacterized protein n=1 Tax=Puccinia graminis f. sp. tritici TaxID=56615 RepID=A0A5B0LVV6_PUCGR|nr:hypothetical protein PGTUg99_031875 [Puccinia graminis f. sp. tritici]
MQFYVLSLFILLSLLMHIGTVEYTDEEKILDPLLKAPHAVDNHIPIPKELDVKPGKNVQPHPQTPSESQALRGPTRGVPPSFISLEKIDQFFEDLLVKESHSGKVDRESSSDLGKILSELGKDLLVESGSEDANLTKKEDLSFFGKELNRVLDALLEVPKDHHESYLHLVIDKLNIASSTGLDFLVYDADEKRLSYIGKTLKSFIDILFKDLEKEHIINKDIASSLVRQALNLTFSGIFFQGAIRELHSASETIKENQLFESSFLTLKYMIDSIFKLNDIPRYLVARKPMDEFSQNLFSNPEKWHDFIPEKKFLSPLGESLNKFLIGVMVQDFNLGLYQNETLSPLGKRISQLLALLDGVQSIPVGPALSPLGMKLKKFLEILDYGNESRRSQSFTSHIQRRVNVFLKEFAKEDLQTTTEKTTGSSKFLLGKMQVANFYKSAGEEKLLKKPIREEATKLFHRLFLLCAFMKKSGKGSEAEHQIEYWLRKTLSLDFMNGFNSIQEIFSKVYGSDKYNPTKKEVIKLSEKILWRTCYELLLSQKLGSSKSLEDSADASQKEHIFTWVKEIKEINSRLDTLENLDEEIKNYTHLSGKFKKFFYSLVPN